MKNNNKYECTDHSVCLRNLGTLLQGVENRVLCELLVELVNIVGGLVLGLNEDWVLLYSISCGHIAGKR